MKILVACEYSGIVREAFRKKGHDVWSCDILPTEIPGQHIQDDVVHVINSLWGMTLDMMIAFPPCTHLSGAGAPSWKIKQQDGRQQAAIDFVMALYYCSIPKVAIENPTGILSSVWRKPDQIINPFMFGEPFKKRTCLWLKGIQPLIATDIVEPTFHYTSNSTRGGKLKDGTRRKSELPIYRAWDSAKERSRTFQGIANAMASQWNFKKQQLV